jgi:hypothetical protein
MVDERKERRRLTGRATARIVASRAQTRFIMQRRAKVILKRRSLGVKAELEVGGNGGFGFGG